MTTDPNWFKSITESYKQEVSESARNLQAEDLYNLVETIQTALQVDLTETQVDSLIEAFRSTVDSEGHHKAGFVRKVLRVLGTDEQGRRTPKGLFGKISTANAGKQKKILDDKYAKEDAEQDARNAVINTGIESPAGPLFHPYRPRPLNND